MRLTIPLCLVAASAVAIAPSRAQAPADNGGWVGKRVITQYGAVLNNPRKPAEEAPARDPFGRERAVLHIYKVEFVNGPWLWLVAERGGVEGWVDASWAIPIDQAIDYYTDQIRANPADPANYNNRARIWLDRGELDIAIADYAEAIRLDPQNEANYNNRGIAWSSKGEHDKAIADYSRAIRLDPKFADAYYGRGIAWRAKQEYGKALADYSEVIRLDPRDARAYNNRAWLRATCPDARYRDGKSAVDDATLACELTGWKEANKIGTLAAAYAERGDFAKAVELQEKAQGLYRDAADVEGGRERLALYKEKTPYHRAPAAAVGWAAPIPRPAPAGSAGEAVSALRATRPYLPPSEVATRLGPDPKPIADYVAALKARLDAILREADPPPAGGLLVAVGMKPGRRARVWCQAVDGPIPPPLLRTLEAELALVHAPPIKNGPAAIAVEFDLFGRHPAAFPEFPDRWRDAAASSRSKVLVPPDDLFRLIWPD